MNPHRLYQDVILDHNRHPRNYGTLPAPSHQAEGVNPICGDRLRISVDIAEAQIAEIRFHGESCAICQASASMMTLAVCGKSVSQARELAAAFRALVQGGADEAQTRLLGRLTVFAGIAQLPSRVKCAVLPWHTLLAATTGDGPATTESALPGLAC